MTEPGLGHGPSFAPADEPWNDPAAEPHIRLLNLSKAYGRASVVANVSLDIYRPELFSLLGASGCGKTTLLRLIAGLDEPTAGSILIDGVSMAGVPPYQRPVNMMFQSYALFPHMSVEENVAFGLRQDRVARRDVSAKVRAALELVQMSTFARRKPHQLSGGQKQRVALARSLVKRPKVLLLDEPLGALDRKLREETRFELVNIQESIGITFIMVTHDPEEAMTMSTRLAVMNKGQILQVGPPAEVYEFPNTRFTAEFVGAVNLFAGRVAEDRGDHALIDSREVGCRVRVDHRLSLPVAMEVGLAIRPEKMRLTAECPPQEHNRVRGTVDEIAYLGGASIYHVLLPSGTRVRVSEPNPWRHAQTRFTWEEPVWVSWDPSNVAILTA